jgi:hypothetical protein
MIFHIGQRRFRPSTGACLARGGIYVLGSYKPLMNRLRKIQPTSSIPAAAKLTTREVVNVVVVEFNAVSAFALGYQRRV